MTESTGRSHFKARTKMVSGISGTKTLGYHKLILFDLVGGGGGQKVPALTLNVNNSFNIKTVANKLSDERFLKSIWQKFCMTVASLINLTFP